MAVEKARHEATMSPMPRTTVILLVVVFRYDVFAICGIHDGVIGISI
jgi:hypothetical protein